MVLSALKKNCHQSVFFTDILRNFHKFLVFAKLIIKSFDANVLPKHFMDFLVRDIIYYTINVIEKGNKYRIHRIHLLI